MTPSSDRIGLLCPDDHTVFSVVGSRLSRRGHAVVYFDPTEPVDEGALSGLSLLVSKRTRPASVRALLRAERLGVPTWNSATGVSACVSRYSQLCLLSNVGFTVPEASREPPPSPYVAKSLYHWGPPPEVDGEGDLYERLLPADPVDYKYYVVDDGRTRRATVLRATSKLWGEKRILGVAPPNQTYLDRIESLMARLGMRGIGVDLIRVDQGWYAVDLNPCPSFAGTGLDKALVESIESALASGG